MKRKHRDTDRLLEFFWARVELDTDPDDCWTWTGTRTSSGYGSCAVYSKRKGEQSTAMMAHRVSWFLHHGEWPPEWPSKIVVDHECSNKLCVNPRHLQLLSSKKNMAKPKPRKRNEQPVQAV